MLAFSGIQILNPDIFNLITEEGKFSLTGLYLDWQKKTLSKDTLIRFCGEMLERCREENEK
jgi:hypothetical protein